MDDKKQKEKEKEKGTVEEFYFANRKDWKIAVAKAPNEKWLKERGLGGSRKSTYLAIERQEAVADVIFAEWSCFENNFHIVSNEILCTVKLQVLPNYPNAEHIILAGVASKPIQCDSGALPYRFPRGKKTNALEYNAPASRSSAISNALSSFGNVFGRNLGRDDVSTNYSLNTEAPKAPKKEKKKKKKSKK